MSGAAVDRELGASVRVWRNARLATLAGETPGLGIVERGAVAIADRRIAYAGPEADMPARWRGAAEEIDCEGRWITPGLIDCHTHLVYAGDRAHEFELRLQGATYEEVARAGGGIVSSVKALRAASEDDLVRKSLRAARRLARERAVSIRTTFLGAHALPPEADGDREGYIDRLVSDMLPAMAAEGLADAVDGFCETIAFSPEQITRVFTAAKALGLPVKLHADQRSTALYQPIISNIPTKPAWRLWPKRERQRFCCRALSISSARRSALPLICSAAMASRWRWRAIAIRALRR
jgi:imidazolonepropionase